MSYDSTACGWVGGLIGWVEEKRAVCMRGEEAQERMGGWVGRLPGRLGGQGGNGEGFGPCRKGDVSL